MRYVLLTFALVAASYTVIAAGDARADRRTPAPKNPAERDEIKRLGPAEDVGTFQIKVKRRLYAEHCILGRIEKVETVLDEALLRVMCNRYAARKYPFTAERNMPSRDRRKNIPLKPGEIDH